MLASVIQVLSADGREQVHAAACAVLERVGVAVEEEALRQELKRCGAKPGSGSNHVRIPRALVQECLDTVLRTPVLHCVNGKVLRHRATDRYYNCLVTDPYIVDGEQGLRRPLLADIARHARLGDALPLVDSIHLMDDTIPGLDSAVAELKCLEVFVANTTTAYHCAPGTLRGTQHWIRIAQIMAGGSLKSNPVLAAYVPTVSPLTLTELNTRQLRMFLEAGVLCNLGPCALAGATAPWPVAGLVVQSWAEFLALLVAAQIILPGAPVLGSGGGAHCMDLRTMASLYSGPSKALASAAINELCADFDLPTASGNLSTLSPGYGVQNGMEAAIGAMTTFFTRVNNYGSLGSLANACGMSAAQIVMHHDLIEILERVRSGIDMTEEKLAVEAIVAQGPGADFLTDPLTLRYLRTDEHMLPPDFERGLGTEAEKPMCARARQRAEEIMDTHTPCVPHDRVEMVRHYVETELKQLDRA